MCSSRHGPAGVGIVVHGEQPAKGVEGQMEGVPEAGRDALQFRAVGTAAVDAAALAAAGQRGAVAADQLVGSARGFRRARSRGRPGRRRRTRTGRCADSRRRESSLTITLRSSAWPVPFVSRKPPDVGARGQEDDAVAAEGEAHGVLEAVGEGRRSCETGRRRPGR